MLSQPSRAFVRVQVRAFAILNGYLLLRHVCMEAPEAQHNCQCFLITAHLHLTASGSLPCAQSWHPTSRLVHGPCAHPSARLGRSILLVKPRAQSLTENLLFLFLCGGLNPGSFPRQERMKPCPFGLAHRQSFQLKPSAAYGRQGMDQGMDPEP